MKKVLSFFKLVWSKIVIFFKFIGKKLAVFFKFIWNKFKAFAKTDGGKTVLSSILSIVIGLFAGLIIMIFISLFNKDISVGKAFKGLGILISGPFASKNPRYVLNNTGDMIFYAVPLIMTGLSVAIAYKTGLFNIGAAGQFCMGTLGSLLVALSIQSTNRVQGVFVWILAILAGIACGALWGCIPGLLKAFFNINEVIICIMTNWIAANITTWIFSNMDSLRSQETSKSAFLMKNVINYTPKLGLDKIFKGSYIDGGIIIAIIIAILIFIILNKTKLGYELKACGSNKHAAKYAGLNEKRNIVLSMAIAGGLAGLGAALYYLNPGIEYNYASQYASLPAYGFNGIASSFLANCNPIGTVFTSLFIRYLNMGGEYLVKVGFNRYVADIIIAIIIFNAAFTLVIKGVLTKIMKKRGEKMQDIRFAPINTSHTKDASSDKEGVSEEKKGAVNNG